MTRLPTVDLRSMMKEDSVVEARCLQHRPCRRTSACLHYHTPGVILGVVVSGACSLCLAQHESVMRLELMARRDRCQLDTPASCSLPQGQ